LNIRHVQWAFENAFYLCSEYWNKPKGVWMIIFVLYSSH